MPKVERWKLERCRSLKREAEIAEERLEEMQPTVGARLDPTPRGTTTSKPTERVAVDRVSLAELMAEIMAEYRELSDEIANACKDLQPTLREIIIMRYIDGLGWEAIARRLSYSEAYIYELHRRALQLIGA